MVADVVIAGSGPAGLAAAGACGRLGLSVLVVAPEPAAVWPASYGMWRDEVPRSADSAWLTPCWPSVEVRFGADDARRLHRAYGRVDNAALRQSLLAGADVRFLAARALAVAHDPQGSTVQTDRGSVRATVVVDASGASGALLDGAGAPSRFQAAWGEIVDTDDLDPSAPRWMDFTPVAGLNAPPTFLYALPLGGSRWLVEETSLARRPALGFDVVRGRLHRRLAAEGVRVRATQGTERVWIPLDTPAPRPQRTVAFGAAAGMIHPSTGYSLARALQTAPSLADALVEGLLTSPAAAARLAWAAIWPTPRLAARELHLYGAGVVSGLDQGETNAFFRAFFETLPPDVIAAWLSDSLPPFALVAAMTRLFPALPPRLRWRVAVGGEVRHLLAAAIA